jgi:hypothetical protein
MVSTIYAIFARNLEDLKKIILGFTVAGMLLAGSEMACTRQTAQQKKTKAFNRKHRPGDSMPCPLKDC